MNKLLKIRILQFNRELKGAGFAWLFLIGTVALMMKCAYVALIDNKLAALVPCALLLICTYIQINRSDKNFVYKHIEQPFLAIYAEYALLIAPFIAMALFTKNWYLLFITYLLLLIIPLIKISPAPKTLFPGISRIIPAINFEIISGLRKSFFPIIILYLLALAFCWFRIAPLVFLWLITMTFISIYDEGESLTILREQALSIKEFLKRKMQRHAFYMLLLYFPVIFIQAAFNPDLWIINLLFIPLQIIILCLAICLKYANYKPGEKLIAGNGTMSIVAMMSLIPYLLPIPLFMAFENYGKACNNLKKYLND
jgi:hypothetical protein